MLRPARQHHKDQAQPHQDNRKPEDLLEQDTQSGTYTIASGTGAYNGISGSGKYMAEATFVGATVNGTCFNNTTADAIQIILTAMTGLAPAELKTRPDTRPTRCGFCHSTGHSLPTSLRRICVVEQLGRSHRQRDSGGSSRVPRSHQGAGLTLILTWFVTKAELTRSTANHTSSGGGAGLHGYLPAPVNRSPPQRADVPVGTAAKIEKFGARRKRSCKPRIHSRSGKWS